MGACRTAGLALGALVLATVLRPGLASAIDLPIPPGPAASPTPNAAPPAPIAPPTAAPAGGPGTAVPQAPPLDPRCRTGRVVCVEETTQQLWLVVDGVVRMNLTIRLGAPSHPTREGAFGIYWKDRKHVSSLYPGLPMPYSLFFSRGEAVHYSPEFAHNGYDVSSHGCIETRDKKQSAALFELVRVGDKVVVYRSGDKHGSRDAAGQVTYTSPLVTVEPDHGTGATGA
jgi:hypothetical protein